eukprot:TRINITY_DN1190_c2_g1_i1.p1 TRINITY_DN1190_c2_g1~~TRINITY_DN1190_c2_g1_i1.p1  ORF type:complete len:371 (+),score=6.91 TRINITY_DN1190_c2_g1_i1:32-1144(+)
MTNNQTITLFVQSVNNTSEGSVEVAENESLTSLRLKVAALLSMKPTSFDMTHEGEQLTEIPAFQNSDTITILPSQAALAPTFRWYNASSISLPSPEAIIVNDELCVTSGWAVGICHSSNVPPTYLPCGAGRKSTGLTTSTCYVLKEKPDDYEGLQEDRPMGPPSPTKIIEKYDLRNATYKGRIFTEFSMKASCIACSPRGTVFIGEGDEVHVGVVDDNLVFCLSGRVKLSETCSNLKFCSGRYLCVFMGCSLVLHDVLDDGSLPVFLCSLVLPVPFAYVSETYIYTSDGDELLVCDWSAVPVHRSALPVTPCDLAIEGHCLCGASRGGVSPAGFRVLREMKLFFCVFPIFVYFSQFFFFFFFFFFPNFLL